MYRDCPRDERSDRWTAEANRDRAAVDSAAWPPCARLKARRTELALLPVNHGRDESCTRVGRHCWISLHNATRPRTDGPSRAHVRGRSGQTELASRLGQQVLYRERSGRIGSRRTVDRPRRRLVDLVDERGERLAVVRDERAEVAAVGGERAPPVGLGDQAHELPAEALDDRRIVVGRLD